MQAWETTVSKSMQALLSSAHMRQKSAAKCYAGSRQEFSQLQAFFCHVVQVLLGRGKGGGGASLQLFSTGAGTYHPGGRGVLYFLWDWHGKGFSMQF